MSRKPRIDLDRFCDPEATRYALREPFLLPDGRVGATDGRIAIAIDQKLTNKPPPNGEKRLPRLLEDIIRPCEAASEWYELPETVPLCRNCDGSGFRSLNSGETCGCYVSLEPGADIAMHYFRWIVRLPVALQWARVTDDMIAFRFDGGMIAVMRIADSYVCERERQRNSEEHAK